MEIESDTLSYKCSSPPIKLDNSFSYLVHPPPPSPPARPNAANQPGACERLCLGLYNPPPPQYLKNTLLLSSGVSESDHSLLCMCSWREKLGSRGNTGTDVHVHRLQKLTEENLETTLLLQAAEACGIGIPLSIHAMFPNRF